MSTYSVGYNLYTSHQPNLSSSASSAAQAKVSRPTPRGSQSWSSSTHNHSSHSRNPQASSSASAAASSLSSSTSATIAYPSIPPPYSGAPPLPAGVSIPQAQWQAGFWQFNPAYKGHGGTGSGKSGGQQARPHVPWIPSQQWGVHRQQPPQQQQQQQQATFNPYKRQPRAPSAEYLATKLSDNPLGLMNMKPVSIEEYYRQGQPSPEPEPEHTPWIWKPRTLASDEDTDGGDASATTPQRPRSGSTPTRSQDQTPQPETAFTSHLALQPTFSPKIVRTPEHYRSDSAASSPNRQNFGTEHGRKSPTPLPRHSSVSASSGSLSLSSSSLNSHGSMGSLSSDPSSGGSHSSFFANGSGNTSARSSLSSWSSAYSNGTTEKNRDTESEASRQPRMLVAAQMSDEPGSMEEFNYPHGGLNEAKTREWGKGKDTNNYSDPSALLLSPLVLSTPMSRSLPAPSLGEVSSSFSDSSGASGGGPGGRVRREHGGPVIPSRSLDTIPEARREKETEDWDTGYKSSRLKPAKTYTAPALDGRNTDPKVEQAQQAPQQQQRLGSRHTMYVDAHIASPPAMVRSGSGTAMPSAAAMVRSGSGGGSGHGSPARSFEGSGGAASAKSSPHYMTPPSSNEASPVGRVPGYGQDHSPGQSHARAPKDHSPRSANPLPPPPVPSSYLAPAIIVRSSSASTAAAGMASMTLNGRDKDKDRDRDKERKGSSGSGNSNTNITPPNGHLSASTSPYSHNSSSGSSSKPSPYSQHYLFSPPMSPSAPAPRPPRVRRGYWNRRGDHLTPDGYIVYAPADLAYPPELATYPPEKEGYQDHEGTFCRYVSRRPELRESLPREGRKAERPYESFVSYVEQ